MKNTLTIVHSENCGPAGKCNCKAFDRATFRPYGLRPGSANSKLDEGLTPGQTDQSGPDNNLDNRIFSVGTNRLYASSAYLHTSARLGVASSDSRQVL